MSNVKVALRVRPLTSREAARDGVETTLTPCGRDSVCLEWDGGSNGCESAGSSGEAKQFKFDCCFWSAGDGQEDVFREIGTRALGAVFEGYNGCIMAYGQSGTGKTYTMIGTELEPGITPRICKALFERICESAGSARVDVSFTEIYNEKVRDLLDPSPKRSSQLRVREHPQSGPYVQGLSRHPVKDAASTLDLVDAGMRRRTSAPTRTNGHSSRSHAIFTIHMTTRTWSDVGTEQETLAKLHLVDLAGSERADRDVLSRVRLKEGATINKSLATLGNVINALGDDHQGLRSGNSSNNSLSTSTASSANCTPRSSPTKRTPRAGGVLFVPYRNSVLTWLLRDSIGGNSHTFIIAAVSPARGSYKETLSTLRFAQRAKRVVNKPVVNREFPAASVRHLKDQVSQLKSILATLTPGGQAAMPLTAKDPDAPTCKVVVDACVQTQPAPADWAQDLRGPVSATIHHPVVADSDHDLVPVKELSVNEEREWSDDSLERFPASSEWHFSTARSLRKSDTDLETDSLDGRERSPTPPFRNHRRVRARKLSRQRPHVRNIFNEDPSAPLDSGATGEERGVTGSQLISELALLVDRLSVAVPPPPVIESWSCHRCLVQQGLLGVEAQQRGECRYHCIRCTGHSRVLSLTQRRSLCMFRLQLLQIRRDLVARTASESLRRHLTYLSSPPCPSCTPADLNRTTDR